jgi:hypothetical protein
MGACLQAPTGVCVCCPAESLRNPTLREYLKVRCGVCVCVCGCHTRAVFLLRSVSCTCRRMCV